MENKFLVATNWLDKHLPLQFTGSHTEPVGETHIDKPSMAQIMTEFAEERFVVGYVAGLEAAKTCCWSSTEQAINELIKKYHEEEKNA